VKTFPFHLKQIFETIPDQVTIYLLKPNPPRQPPQERLPDQSLTYRDLMRGALGYARALEQAGIQPGEVVILILQHGLALLEAFFGAVLHGAIPSIMPFLTEKLSPEGYRRSLAALFEVTAPSAVVTYPEFVAEVQQALGDNSPVRAILISSEIVSPAEVNFAGLRGFERSPEDIVLLQHSSGTTGLQKGVALSHQAVFNQLDSYARALNLTQSDGVVSWLPLYHDMGLIAGFIMPVLYRIPLALMSPFDWVRAPYKLLQAASTYRATLCWLPNFAYNFCAQKIRDRDLSGVDLSSLRVISNCSEPVHFRSHQMFLERFQAYGLRPAALATCYAMAENVFAVTQGGVTAPLTVDTISQKAFFNQRLALPASQDEPRLQMVSCGRPIDNTLVRVVDDQRRELPERHLGEIALRSDCMLTGYYRREDATSSAFHQGWYLTGDLGYLAEGELYVTGRKKDVIIVGGKNVYPQDLEALACEVPGVYPGRVVAFGLPNDETGTEDVVIVAEMEQSQSGFDPQAAARLSDEVRQRITRGSDIALRIVKIVERGWLIKTSSGKIARSTNRDKYRQAES